MKIALFSSPTIRAAPFLLCNNYIMATTTASKISGLQQLTTNTTATQVGSSTPPPTSSGAGDSSSSSFCFSCGFNFGHIINGLDDSTAGMLMVLSIMLIIGIISFLIGCCICRRARSKVQPTHTKAKTKYTNLARNGDEDEDEDGD